jgi:cobalamin biosynthesis Mg chelatase CobN
VENHAKQTQLSPQLNTPHPPPIFQISKAGFAVKKCKASKELGDAVTERAAKLLKKWKKAVASQSSSSSSSSSQAEGSQAASASQASPAPAAAPASASASAAAAAASAGEAAAAPRPKSGGGGGGEGNTVQDCLPEEEAGGIRDLPAPRLKIANLLLGVFLKHDVGTEDREVFFPFFFFFFF